MISNEIEQNIQRHIDAADISTKRVLAEYARIAFASLALFLRIEDGQVVVDISVATKNDLALLANVKPELCTAAWT